MLCVVAPVLQRLFNALELVSVTEPPLQNMVGPLGVMVGGVGAGYTLIMNGVDVFEQPVDVSVTVTVYGYDPGVLKHT